MTLHNVESTHLDNRAKYTVDKVYLVVWRTSTSEPTPDGIIWTALKDVSKYTPLFSKPGTLIVDLNNVVDPSKLCPLREDSAFSPHS